MSIVLTYLAMFAGALVGVYIGWGVAAPEAPPPRGFLVVGVALAIAVSVVAAHQDLEGGA